MKKLTRTLTLLVIVILLLSSSASASGFIGTRRALLGVGGIDRWVAVGQGTNSIAYSADGVNWTGLGTTTFSTAGYGVASAPCPSLYPGAGKYKQ